MGLISKQNSSKTASKISKTNFYFVTSFYSLCDICKEAVSKLKKYREKANRRSCGHSCPQHCKQP